MRKFSPKTNVRVVLASASPRRREMLQALNIDFEVCVPNIPERWTARKNAARIARELAVAKVKKCRNCDRLVIGMDTLVVMGQSKLGKPSDAEDARRMLQSLSGKTHQVITGVALSWNGRVVSQASVTEVQFRRIHSQEIDWYIQSDEPFDKAGAYAIQGLGRIFIDRIEGCYYNVVGFPLTVFQRLLRRFGLTIFDLQRT
jgi:nucleoside triphosphate pyrophosphatase